MRRNKLCSVGYVEMCGYYIFVGDGKEGVFLFCAAKFDVYVCVEVHKITPH